MSAVADLRLDDLATRCAFAASGGELHLAVSGGPDSSALLVLAAQWDGAALIAHHVDHALRPDSAGEAQMVAELAQAWGAKFVAHRVEVEVGPNLEARARQLRFAVLPPDVATGHTMDDQAETVLMNLLRGTGPAGIGALRPGPTHPIVRLRRAETHELCRALRLVTVNDATNDDPAYLRNRIRSELLPLCAELARRDPVPGLARASTLVGEESELLDLLTLALVDDPTDARMLARTPEPLARRAIRQWLTGNGDRASSGGYPPTSAEVARVLDVVDGRARATEIRGSRVARSGGRLTRSQERSVTIPEVHTEVGPLWAGDVIGEVVVDSAALSARVIELGAAITKDYVDDPPLLVGVLKGAMIFMSDLCRSIELPVDVDFMAVASYGSATQTSGVVRIVKDLDADLAGRHVLVVEDIIDSGLTLNYLRRYLQARQPKSVEVCALLVKEGEQRTELDLRYVGFNIPPGFVVGYGLDVAERFRNLPAIFTYRPDGASE